MLPNVFAINRKSRYDSRERASRFIDTKQSNRMRLQEWGEIKDHLVCYYHKSKSIVRVTSRRKPVRAQLKKNLVRGFFSFFVLLLATNDNVSTLDFSALTGKCRGELGRADQYGPTVASSHSRPVYRTITFSATGIWSQAYKSNGGLETMSHHPLLSKYASRNRCCYLRRCRRSCSKCLLAISTSHSSSSFRAENRF